MENKIYTEKTRKLRQNTQKIANFLRYYGKIHSKLPIFRVKSVKIYTGQKKLHKNSRGSRDKYQVWSITPFLTLWKHLENRTYIAPTSLQHLQVRHVVLKNRFHPFRTLLEKAIRVFFSYEHKQTSST